MCGRYVSPDQAAAERAWHVGRQRNPLAEVFEPHYNIAPQRGNPERYISVIRNCDDGTAVSDDASFYKAWNEAPEDIDFAKPQQLFRSGSRS
jgi:putative SOS response-associated peptidase YedK